MSRTLVVAWLAKLGQESRVEQILQNMIPLSRAEPGCIRYDVFRAVDEPCHFLLVEVYEDDAALQAHGESDHFRRFVLGEALALLESRVRVKYEPLAELDHWTCRSWPRHS